MNWLVRHIDWAVVSVALVLSVVWIGDCILHPLIDKPPMVIVNGHHVPPGAPASQPSTMARLLETP
jgi:hypothetical protein